MNIGLAMTIYYGTFLAVILIGIDAHVEGKAEIPHVCIGIVIFMLLHYGPPSYFRRQVAAMGDGGSK